METSQQQPQVDTSVSNPNIASLPSADHANLALPPANITEPKWQRIGRQTSEILAQMPDYISSFFSRYKQAIYSVVLILLAVIAVKLALAVLDAVHDIPLLAPTFELIGLGYGIWFTFRYLLKTDKRQELFNNIRSWKRQILGQEVSQPS